MFDGLQILTSTAEPFVKQVGEDWSRVRSPARAARRRRRGFPQNITPIYAPTDQVVICGGKMIMHPATAAALSAYVRAQP